MGFLCLVFATGMCAAGTLALFAEPILAATLETRFCIGAQWRYSRTLPRANRPALWRWPVGAVRMWWHQFLFSDGTETTELRFKNSAIYQRGPLGRAVRISP